MLCISLKRTKNCQNIISSKSLTLSKIVAIINYVLVLHVSILKISSNYKRKITRNIIWSYLKYFCSMSLRLRLIHIYQTRSTVASLQINYKYFILKTLLKITLNTMGLKNSNWICSEKK